MVFLAAGVGGRGSVALTAASACDDGAAINNSTEAPTPELPLPRLRLRLRLLLRSPCPALVLRALYWRFTAGCALHPFTLRSQSSPQASASGSAPAFTRAFYLWPSCPLLPTAFSSFSLFAPHPCPGPYFLIHPEAESRNGVP